MRAIRRALLSVSDKTGLIEFARSLTAMGVHIISTGGTARSLSKAGLEITDISDWTGFPEIMDGRVKTLHPKVHGGLLAVRDNNDHLQAMEAHGIGAIDLLAVNLYPFEQTLAAGGSYEELVENIDIGGPAMTRAAAKNHADVTTVVDPADYASVIAEMESNGGATLPATRRRLAAKAFARTAAYDSMVSTWLLEQAGDLTKKLLTENHPDYARRLNKLGSLYKDMGEYPKALSLLVQARDPKRNCLPRTIPSTPAL